MIDKARIWTEKDMDELKKEEEREKYEGKLQMEGKRRKRENCVSGKLKRWERI